MVSTNDVFLDPQENGNSHANGNSHGPSTVSDSDDPLSMESNDPDAQRDDSLVPQSNDEASSGASLVSLPEHHDPVIDHSLLGS